MRRQADWCSHGPSHALLLLRMKADVLHGRARGLQGRKCPADGLTADGMNWSGEGNHTSRRGNG